MAARRQKKSLEPAHPAEYNRAVAVGIMLQEAYIWEKNQVKEFMS
jgi:hypothetical protein